MKKEDTPNKSKENFPTMMGILILAMAFYTVALLAAYHSNGTFNPYLWGPKTNYYMIIISALFFSVLLWYWDQVEFYKFPTIIFKGFNIDEYSPDKPWLDVLISHYSNVATVGLFFAVGIFSLKDSSFISENGVGRIMALVCIVGFLVYSLLLLRLAKRFISLESFPAYIGICLFALFLDTTALEMIVKSVPAA